ncbi:MAG: hypothetical protein FJZ96_02500 [Chloroflexi bacterium]|nr:hypothetical protein [Chloroflexota bacterium]
MKKMGWVLAFIPATAAILFFGACNWPDEELPPCTAGQLQSPEDLSPDGEWVIWDLEDYLYLSVGYPATTCKPDFFEFYLWTGLEPETPGMTGRVNWEDETSEGVWSIPWPTPLEPGNTYYWRVSAGLETGPGDDINGPSVVGHFFTGPECTASAAYLPVELISPEDNLVVTDLSEPIIFAWDDPTPCLVDYGFEIQISRSSDFSEYEYRVPILQTVYAMDPVEIPTVECQRYFWRIKTDPAGPPEEPFSETRSFLVNTGGLICPFSLHPAFAIALENLNCRSGPGVFYPVLQTFETGSRAPIEGTNEERTWWQILAADDLRCWVWAEQVEEEGDTDEVPGVAVDPPPPTAAPTATPTPIPCSSYKDSQSCNANPLCTWYIPKVGGLGSCVDK